MNFCFLVIPQKNREQFKKCSFFHVLGVLAHLAGLLWPTRVVRHSQEQSSSRWSSQLWTPMSTKNVLEMQVVGSTPDLLNEIQSHIGPKTRISILKLWSPPKSGNHGVVSDVSFCFCGAVPHKFHMPSQGDKFNLESQIRLALSLFYRDPGENWPFLNVSEGK